MRGSHPIGFIRFVEWFSSGDRMWYAERLSHHFSGEAARECRHFELASSGFAARDGRLLLAPQAHANKVRHHAMHGTRQEINRREILVRLHRVGVVRCRTCSGSRGERVGRQRGAPGCGGRPEPSRHIGTTSSHVATFRTQQAGGLFRGFLLLGSRRRLSLHDERVSEVEGLGRNKQVVAGERAAFGPFALLVLIAPDQRRVVHRAVLG